MRGNHYSNVEVFLDRQIGMEPLVIDWAKGDAKMAKIVRNIHVYCYVMLFLSRLCHNRNSVEFQF